MEEILIINDDLTVENFLQDFLKSKHITTSFTDPEKAHTYFQEQKKARSII